MDNMLHPSFDFVLIALTLLLSNMVGVCFVVKYGLLFKLREQTFYAFWH